MYAHVTIIKNLLTYLLTGARNDGSAEPSRRSKRALPDANIVELLAMPDESVYQA